MHVGVDGCRGGRYAVRRDVSGQGLVAGVYASFAGLLESVGDPAVVAIDIPIGLRVPDDIPRMKAHIDRYACEAFGVS